MKVGLSVTVEGWPADIHTYIWDFSFKLLNSRLFIIIRVSITAMSASRQVTKILWALLKIRIQKQYTAVVICISPPPLLSLMALITKRFVLVVYICTNINSRTICYYAILYCIKSYRAHIIIPTTYTLMSLEILRCNSFTYTYLVIYQQ